ncbi:MAG: YggS family pyridoxal phosphate-dependent enzyme [Endomicrobiia bacterium]
MLEENLKSVLERIENSAKKTGRKKEDIKLVVVTKNVTVENIKEVVELGIKDIGENRVQEAEEKHSLLFTHYHSLFTNIKWHMIGHLQTNKTKKAVQIFDLIQSVDSIHLAEEIDKQAKKINKIQDCLIEVKVSEEETKYGCLPEKVKELIEKILELKNIRLCGLMAMAPFFEKPELTRPYFQKAKKLFDDHYSLLNTYCSLPYLSMGMSNDFEIAIEEGANMVRIGTAIFKENV